MEIKRSRGVTFWAWTFIVISSLEVLDNLINYQHRIQEAGIGFYVFSFLNAMAYLICGIYLLKLKEPARKAVIYLGVISILAIPIYLPPLLNSVRSDVQQEGYHKAFLEKERIIQEQMRPENQQQALEKLRKTEESGKKYLPIFMIIFVGFFISILEIIPLYLFTRPKVREQFKALR